MKVERDWTNVRNRMTDASLLSPEICDYPERGVFGVYQYAAGKSVSRHIGRADQSLPYWSDE